jgi:hypothetical protein
MSSATIYSFCVPGYVPHRADHVLDGLRGLASFDSFAPITWQ